MNEEEENLIASPKNSCNSKETKINKLLNIEFLRFLSVISIVTYHLFTGWLPVYCSDIPLFHHIHELTRDSVRAVDFFFIISGFFLVYTFKRDLSVIDFLKKKIVRLWPVAVFAVCAWFVIYLLGFIPPEKFGTFDNIFGLFMINNIGITTSIGINVQSWYISSLILVLLFYFYILKYLDKHITNLIISVITLFSYSFLIHIQNGSLTGEIETYYYIFNVGIMRALAGCGLGYIIGISGICNNLSESKKQKTLSLFVIGCFEILIFTFLIYNMCFNKLNYTNDMIFILAFVFLFIIFVRNYGIISKWMNNKFYEIIGKYAYSIFMSHRIAFAIISATLWKTDFVIYHNYLTIFYSIIIAILFGIVVYYLIEKPFAVLLKKYLLTSK